MEKLSDQITKMMDRRQLTVRFQKIMDTVVNSDEEVISFLNQHADQLTPETISRGAAKLYEFVNEKQKIQNGEMTLVPGYEPQLILNNHLIDVEYQPTEKTVQQRKSRTIKERITNINMPKLIRSATLSDFDTSDQSRINVFNLINDFIDSYVATPDSYHRGLYLYGSFGVGKTYLMGGMANELARIGVKTTLIHFPSFAVEMKNAIAENGTADKLNQIKESQVLVIDDVGADSMSAWIRDDVLGIILEYRMQEELPTFFTSNFSMAALEKDHLTMSQRGDIEPLKAKRLMERIKFLAKEVEMIGNNRRNPKNI